MDCNRLYSWFGRYLRKFNGIIALFCYLYRVSPQIANQLAKRISINDNPVARLNDRWRSILHRCAHFCHTRDIVT